MKNSLIFLLLLSLTSTAYAKRYALVIAYSSDVGKLKNPINDATDMAALLTKKQFTVTTLTNATKRQMKEGILAFTRQLSQKDVVGLFFFAGHGIEVNRRNYLIPVDANIQNEADVEYESIDAGRFFFASSRSQAPAWECMESKLRLPNLGKQKKYQFIF